ncbi:helix-turn-helix domain-containing protein [Leucobacter musarum]|uniref:helix-turn-helix domain-containing protein n=1 Tax=Leucobacter musarum TaxID=1930747 RepID=UPI000AE8465A|nr:helix-turn-helix transcriptional regulator [Leucobacter musarum]
MDMNEAVAKAIGAERNISGMTVRALSDAAGIPERSLMRILQSEREIKVNQVAQIAEALRLYPHEIIEHAETILERAERDAPTLANVTPLRQTEHPVEEERAAAKDSKTVKRRRDDSEFFE